MKEGQRGQAPKSKNLVKKSSAQKPFPELTPSYTGGLDMVTAENQVLSIL